MLASAHPVDAIWRAVLARDDAALSAIDPATEDVRLLVGRSAAGADVVRLTRSAFAFAAELLAGKPLGPALDTAVDDEAAALLADLLAAERFADFAVIAR